MDVLADNKFDISRCVGSILIGDRGLSSLESIRDVFSVAAPSPRIQSALCNRTLWNLFQTRHIIVHKRGRVDKFYIEKTGDKNQNIGLAVKITSYDIDAYMKCVAQVAEEIADFLSTDAQKDP